MRRRHGGDDGGDPAVARGPPAPHAARDAGGRALQPVPGRRVRRGLHAGLVRRRGRAPRAVHPRARGLGPERGDQRRRALGGARRRPRHRAADHHQRVDRPAGAAGVDRAGPGDLRRVRRDPGDEEQPDRGDGPARPPRPRLDVEDRRADREPARLPGPAGQHHRDAALPRAPARGHDGADRARRPGPARPGCSGTRRTRSATAPPSPRPTTTATSWAATRAAWSSSAARGRS